MAEKQVRRLPVVEDGRLVGILAQADVSRAAQPRSTGQMVEEISEEADVAQVACGALRSQRSERP